MGARRARIPLAALCYLMSDARTQQDFATRDTLDCAALLVLLVTVVAGAALISVSIHGSRPGDPLPQALAALGAVLLLVPALFSLAKRSDVKTNAPAWFSLHVVCSGFGCVCIAGHVVGGDLASPLGLLTAALVFLVLQGIVMRWRSGRVLAEQFARRPASFESAAGVDRNALRALIEAKQQLLMQLDSKAQEALFSPRLWHWFAHPRMSWRYARLVARELELTGMRSRAQWRIAAWRRLHMAVAVLFLLGLLAHIVVALFFAEFVSGEDPAYWWHVATLERIA